MLLLVPVWSFAETHPVPHICYGVCSRYRERGARMLTMPVSDLQDNFDAVAEACANSRGPVYLTRDGQPAFVIMDAQAYEAGSHEADPLYEQEMRRLAAIEKGHQQVLEGKTVTFEEARALRRSYELSGAL